MDHPIIRFFSRNQVLTALAIIVIGWFLLQIQEVIIALFLAFIIMAAFNPLVHVLESFKLPRGIAVAIAYAIFLVILVILILPLIPFFATQIQKLVRHFPAYADHTASLIGVRINTSQLNSALNNALGTITMNAYALTTQVFGGIFSLLTVFVISFFMLLDEKQIDKSIVNLFPKKHQKVADTTIRRVKDKLGAWVRGQLLLSLSVGALTWLALFLIGMDFALPLALVAGFLEIVPTLGPILAAIPAIIVALGLSTSKAALVLIVYIIVQLLENNILVPRIMSRAVGLNPIIVIVAVIAGGKLLGLIGALLSIPFVTLLVVLYQTFRDVE